MTEISRSALFGRLNQTALKGIETATGFCKMRGNPYVELVHWVHVLLQDPQNDIAAIRTAFGLDEENLARQIVSALDALPRGATAISDFSPQIEEAIEKGWLYASLQFGAGRVRTGHLLYGMLKTATLKNALFSMSGEFRKVQVEKLAAEFESICAPSHETTQGADLGGGVSGDDAGAGPVGDGEALAKFSVDLTQQARDGKIDRIVGRDSEIRQCIDVLLRRRQNNPILVGEAGVGKTAVVEGFAKRIVDGDVPPSLRGVTLRSLDIGLMQAGASMKGEFEKRLRQVIDEVEASPTPIVLFIDEAHTLIGAGGQAGTGDAANLLKPALARGNLRTIAATTYAEYRQYFEKDPALTRRFQTVDVGEPETNNAIAMIRSVAPMMEKHHNVVVLDDAVEAAVKLSQRYVPARQLPDKAVSLLDTACARVAVSQHATPAQVEDRKRRLELLEVERGIVEREAAGQYNSGDRLPKLLEAIAEATAALEEVNAKWEREKEALTGVVAARDALTEARKAAGDGAVEGEDALQVALKTALAAMAEAHGDEPMVFGVVDSDAIAAVVGDWTGIPMGRMVKNEIESVLTIADQLKKRVIGQDHAMDSIAKRIQTSRAKLDNPNKPVGVFMLCGPSGVGKTETAMVLSELLFSGDDSLIVINMSEFQEAHTVSTLKGAPAGYVGFGQGGVLTEAVRRRPYSVVLLDEVEKAHPDVHEMFFQVFDKGFMNDAEGRYIDFKNTLILLTSNVGTDLITSMSEDEEMKPDPDALATALRPELLKVFPPALLGRLIVQPYYPLSPAMLQGIVRIQLNRIVKRIAESHGITFNYSQDVVDLIVSRCNEVASGGRLIDAILTNTMLPDLSIELLNRQMSGEEVKVIDVTVEGDGFGYAFG
ncbi:AAA family ATPase [Novosphingobium sp. AAP83]|uniref:type VI secretion system ATPase TssH n=1 Tax=Novosphingobium sp. AAP83 TaxID=1523425 RepID=UPI0006B954F4|nr:type VI secretion system ATPase TssH [Novosphingobium sp. AAP83]KPF91347.1 AAA family ATPase [Novosphingobium sp. AAP83]